VKRPAIALPGAVIAAALVLAAPLTTASPARSAATNIDAAAIERAIAVGRSDEEARQRFHQDYFIALNDPLLERLEIVTEFRRVVLTTEDRVHARDTDWGPRQAAAMLQPWRNKIALILHVNFPPNNVYRVMPRFDLVLYGRAQARAPGRIEPLDLLETPRYINGQPAPPGTPILAGTVQATFGIGTLNPRGVYLCGIAFEGRELRRVEIDFGRVE
jgi:hypothetical protein